MPCSSPRDARCFSEPLASSLNTHSPHEIRRLTPAECSSTSRQRTCQVRFISAGLPATGASQAVRAPRLLLSSLTLNHLEPPHRPHMSSTASVNGPSASLKSSSGTPVHIIGVSHTSPFYAHLASQVIEDVQPSAVVLEVCEVGNRGQYSQKSVEPVIPRERIFCVLSRYVRCGHSNRSDCTTKCFPCSARVNISIRFSIMHE
jgi:hypothetical protein